MYVGLYCRVDELWIRICAPSCALGYYINQCCESCGASVQHVAESHSFSGVWSM